MKKLFLLFSLILAQNFLLALNEQTSQFDHNRIQNALLAHGINLDNLPDFFPEQIQDSSLWSETIYVEDAVEEHENNKHTQQKKRGRKKRIPFSSYTFYCPDCIFETLKTCQKLTPDQLAALNFESYYVLIEHGLEYAHDVFPKKPVCLECKRTLGRNHAYAKKDALIRHIKSHHLIKLLKKSHE